ncbi:MAG: flavin reductase family protein [Dehalococcoidaceae bacterium]|nr:flavin reductase family protein [Dehalococcoidaceae bacterium]
MKKIAKTEIGKFSYFFPCQATIVTSHYKGKDNAMAVAWHMPLSGDPPLYAVGIAPSKYSHGMITGSGQFGVNFMPFNHAELVAATGGPSGKCLDKFDAFMLAKDPPLITDVPILSAAYVAFECILEDSHVHGDHTLFIGRVVAVHQAPEAFNEKGQLDMKRVQPVLYMGSDRYVKINRYDINLFDRKTAADNLIGKKNNDG